MTLEQANKVCADIKRIREITRSLCLVYFDLTDGDEIEKFCKHFNAMQDGLTQLELMAQDPIMEDSHDGDEFVEEIL